VALIDASKRRALAEAGERGPAEQVLAANPAIADLHLALLEADYRETGRFDKARLDLLATLTANHGADPRYSYPSALRDAGRGRIIAWIKQAGDSVPVKAPTRDIPMPDSLYCRSEHCDQETLEADLIVMNTENFEVVTLNATGQALWEALAEPVDIEDIASTFAQAVPRIDPAVLRTDI
jgi:hypothetical protein